MSIAKHKGPYLEYFFDTKTNKYQIYFKEYLNSIGQGKIKNYYSIFNNLSFGIWIKKK